MTKVIIRYKIKPEFVDENTRLIQAVFTELSGSRPADLRYGAFIAEDGVTFFHVASVEGDDNPLFESTAFKAFRKDIANRCDEIPVPTQLSEVGSYGCQTVAINPSNGGQ